MCWVVGYNFVLWPNRAAFRCFLSLPIKTMCFYQFLFSLFFSSICYHNKRTSPHKILVCSTSIWTHFCNRWCVSDVSASMCFYFLQAVTNNLLYLTKHLLTALLPKVFAGIAAKTSAMFLSLPVKARLEEMSFFYPCRETPQGQRCTCTQRKGRGIGISPIKILLAKFPDTHGGKHPPLSSSHAEGAARGFSTVMKSINLLSVSLRIRNGIKTAFGVRGYNLGN